MMSARSAEWQMQDMGTGNKPANFLQKLYE